MAPTSKKQLKYFSNTNNSTTLTPPGPPGKSSGVKPKLAEKQVIMSWFWENWGWRGPVGQKIRFWVRFFSLKVSSFVLYLLISKSFFSQELPLLFWNPMNIFFYDAYLETTVNCYKNWEIGTLLAVGPWLFQRYLQHWNCWFWYQFQ